MPAILTDVELAGGGSTDVPILVGKLGLVDFFRGPDSWFAA
jgi:hypothetical protein